MRFFSYANVSFKIDIITRYEGALKLSAEYEAEQRELTARVKDWRTTVTTLWALAFVGRVLLLAYKYYL